VNAREILPAGNRARGRIGAALVIVLLAGCGAGTADWIQQLKSPEVIVRRASAEQLSDVAATSPDVISALRGAIDDGDPEVRRWACRGLGRHQAAEAIPQLESRLKDPAKPVRRAAAFSLQRLAPESTGYQQEFLAGIREGDGGLIVMIKGFEPPASWAVPVLVDLTKDKRPGIRRLAIEALAEIAPAMEGPRKAFEAARRDSDDRVREAAAKALERKS
jgi:HEAT repeat protein